MQGHICKHIHKVQSMKPTEDVQSMKPTEDVQSMMPTEAVQEECSTSSQHQQIYKKQTDVKNRAGSLFIPT